LDEPGDYVMLALVPPPEFTVALADPAGEDPGEHHITLHFLGTVEEAGGEAGRARLEGAVRSFCAHAGYRELVGRVGGYGTFAPSAGSDGKHVLFALWDVPGISELHTWLGRYLECYNVPRRARQYGFIPHETIRYSDEPIRELPVLPVLPETTFDSIYLVWGGSWQEHKLRQLDRI
jgi:2'-5' RNA ligase